MTCMQENAYLSLAYRLPDIVKQLEIANKLKALELKFNAYRTLKSIPEWIAEIDKIMKD